MLNIRKAGGYTFVINEKNIEDLERFLIRLDDIEFLKGKLHASSQ